MFELELKHSELVVDCMRWNMNLDVLSQHNQHSNVIEIDWYLQNNDETEIEACEVQGG